MKCLLQLYQTPIWCDKQIQCFTLQWYFPLPGQLRCITISCNRLSSRENIIFFHAFWDLLLSPLVDRKKRMCFQFSVKVVRTMLQSKIVRTATKRIYCFQAWVQFKVYHVSMKIWSSNLKYILGLVATKTFKLIVLTNNTTIGCYLCVFIMSHVRFKGNLRSAVAWMSRNWLVKTGAISEI